MMVAVSTSICETSVKFYQPGRRKLPEDNLMNSRLLTLPQFTFMVWCLRTETRYFIPLNYLFQYAASTTCLPTITGLPVSYLIVTTRSSSSRLSNCTDRNKHGIRQTVRTSHSELMEILLRGLTVGGETRVGKETHNNSERILLSICSLGLKKT